MPKASLHHCIDRRTDAGRVGYLTVAMVAVLAGGASLVSPGEVAQLRRSNAGGGAFAATLLPCAKRTPCASKEENMHNDTGRSRIQVVVNPTSGLCKRQ